MNLLLSFESIFLFFFQFQYLLFFFFLTFCLPQGSFTCISFRPLKDVVAHCLSSLSLLCTNCTWFYLSHGFQICKFATVSLLCPRLSYLLSDFNKNSKVNISKTRTVYFPLQTCSFPMFKIIVNISKLHHSSKCLILNLKGHSWKIIFLIFSISKCCWCHLQNSSFQFSHFSPWFLLLS